MDAKEIIGLVTISVVLVLLLKNASDTSNVLNAINQGVQGDVSVLQGNSPTGSNSLLQNTSAGLGSLGNLGSLGPS